MTLFCSLGHVFHLTLDIIGHDFPINFLVVLIFTYVLLLSRLYDKQASDCSFMITIDCFPVNRSKNQPQHFYFYFKNMIDSKLLIKLLHEVINDE